MLGVVVAAVAAQGAGPVAGVAQSPTGPPAVAPSPNTCVPGAGSRNWCGDGRLATQAKLAGPQDVATAADGTIYVADTLNNVIRRISPDGSIATVAGDAVPDAPQATEPAATASFDHPGGVAVQNDGGLLVADTGHAAIRRVAPDGLVTTVIGGPGHLGTTLRAPTDVAVLPDGGYLIVDRGRHMVLRVTGEGRVFRAVGTGRPGFVRRILPGSRSPLRAPSQVAPLGGGDMLIADSGNGVVRWLRRGRLRTLAVRPRRAIYGVASSGGRVLISDAAGVHDVTTQLAQTRVAGVGRAGFSGDVGEALSVALDHPRQLAPAPDGTLLIAEEGSDRIRRLRVGQLVTVAGTDTPAARAASASAPPRAVAAGGPACAGYAALFGSFEVRPRLDPLHGTSHGVAVKIATSRVARVRLRLARGGRVAASKTYGKVSNRQPIRVAVHVRMRHGRYRLSVSGRSLSNRMVRCVERVVVVR
jgi:hypothetical protein